MNDIGILVQPIMLTNKIEQRLIIFCHLSMWQILSVICHIFNGKMLWVKSFKVTFGLLRSPDFEKAGEISLLQL